ncbi:MAG TPA: hypothetical protein DIV86_06120 [Alphaproteobacteria bacterium]|nr:hypothetical protein [Alphaproteobacteria bacterium]
MSKPAKKAAIKTDIKQAEKSGKTLPSAQADITAKKAQKKIVYVKGLSQDRVAKVAKMDPYYRNMQLQMPGNNNLEGFGSIQGFKNINICFNGQPCRMEIPDILVNCMADPDSLEDKLKYLQNIIPRLKQQNPGLKIINPPEGVLKTRRNDIANLFQGLKAIVVPKAIKIAPKSRRDFIEKIKASGLKMPVIVREAAVHGGIKLTLIQNFNEEQVEQLDKFALDGRDHYVTEFVDFKSKDGYYRKARIIMIGGEVNLRHLIVSEHWNIHGKSREIFVKKHPQLDIPLAREEKKFLQAGKDNFSKEVQVSLQQIYKTLGLDIFGMDVGILPGGKLLVFEINAAMEFLALHMKHAPYIMDQIAVVRSNFIKHVAGEK